MSTAPVHHPQRNLRSLIGGLSICLVILLAVAAAKSWRDLALARDRQAHLEQEIVATSERIEKLNARIDDLKHDPATLERIAREDLGYAREGEIVLRTEPTEGLMVGMKALTEAPVDGSENSRDPSPPRP